MMYDYSPAEQAEHRANDRAEILSTIFTAIALAVVLALAWAVIVILIPQRAGAQEITETSYGRSTNQVQCDHYRDSPAVDYRAARGYYLVGGIGSWCDPRDNWRITSARIIFRIEAKRPYESTWHAWAGPTSYTDNSICGRTLCGEIGGGGEWRVAHYPRAPMHVRAKVKYIIHGFSTLYPNVTFTDTIIVYANNGMAWNIGWAA